MSKNTIFNKYPTFIHGEARGENDEFIVHTRYPRFLARRTFDDNFTGMLPSEKIKGEIGQTPAGKLAYKSSVGIWFEDFIFFDSRASDETAFIEALRNACDQAAADTLMLDEETDGIYS